MLKNVFVDEKKFNLADKNEEKRFIEAAKALASPIRLKILRALKERNHTITELSNLLDIPTSGIIFHLKQLEKANLIKIQYLTESKKNETQYITLLVNNVIFNLFAETKEEFPLKNKSFEIPIGSYVDIYGEDIHICTKESLMEKLEINNSFSPARLNAYIIEMFGKCHITYKVPNFYKDNLEELSFSLEACSETSFYHNNFKSEIFFYINNIELGSYICPADFGGRRGKLNPKWYPNNITQYGQLISVSVNKSGVYINGVLINEKVTLNSLSLEEDKPLILELRVKDDSKFPGGMNIFSKNLGDFPQDIKFNYSYSEE